MAQPAAPVAPSAAVVESAAAPASDCCPGAAPEPARAAHPAARAVALPAARVAGSLEAFRAWAERYAAVAVAEKAALLPEGRALAGARREAMGALIRRDPRAAIEALLPYALRKALPPEIAAMIEHRVSGRGDLMVLAVRPLPGQRVEEPIYRTASVAGRDYRAYTYGRRLADISRPRTPILGVGVQLADGKNLLAVREEGYAVLDKAEAADLRAAQGVANAVCPISGDATAARGDETAVDTGAKIVWLCSHGHIGEYLQTPEGLVVAAAGGTGNSGSTSPVVPATATEGNKTFLAIRVRFSDQAAEPTSDANLQTELQKVMDQWHAWSYGKLEGSFAFTPTLVLPQNEAYYAAQGDPSYAVMVAARAAADAYVDAGSAHPYLQANWDYDAIVFSGSIGGYCGLGYVGGKGTWIKCYSAGVMLHEWGHNLGLWHANFWQASTDSPIGAGTHVEYGSKYSVMGSAGLNAYNSLERYTLHWLEPTDVATLAAGSTYRLYNADKSTLTATHPYALRIYKESQVYYVEYRPNWNGTTHDFTTDNGAMICRTQPGSDADQLLDMNPLTSAGNGDAALLVGRSFTDAAQGLTVTPIARGGVAPDDWLDMVVNFTSPVSDSAPVAVVAASNFTPATGVSVTLTATASDPDGDPLAYAWDFGENAVNASNVSVNNSAVQTKSWSTAGDYNVRCTVSDMKGKSSVQNLVIRVGAPANFTISGRVVKSDGTPVQDVLIEDTNSHLTSTDADGRYTLGGLAAGSYTISALHSGWTLAAQFANPVVIGPGAVNINFTATPPATDGGVTLEHWDGITGNAVSNLTTNAAYPNSPTYVTTLEGLFEAGTNIADNYGQRARAWFRPPTTGAYTFYIASDDNSELWLSTDATAANKVLIASVPGSTGSRVWTTFASQTSAAKTLTAGQRYYIEALHKEGVGGDNLAVGVDFPGAVQHRPIETTYLDPINAVIPPVPVNTVTVAATDASASETGPDTGTFTITRTGDTAAALPVYFDVTGTAIYGSDYQPTGLSATIPAGAASTTVTITPIVDAIPEVSETVILTLAPAVSYTLGATVSDTVIIQGNGATQVSIVATDATASETGGDTGTFTLTRTGDPTNALTVNLTIGGSAANGTDYATLAPSVIFPAGQSTTTITITALADGVAEPEETVILTLAAGAGYTVIAPASATVRILAQPGTGGGILREWWDGIGSGTNVADLMANANFPETPTGRAIVTTAFESQQNRADSFGERWRAIFTAPVTGNYVFYIASDDSSELWLSTDATPDRKSKIAYVNGYTGFEVWTTYASQTSAAIPLVAGQRYYIEALYKEGGGGDFMSVGVQYPNGALERPIPAHRLDPFTPSTLLAAPWTSQDIGAVGSPGTAGLASDTLPSAPKHRYRFTGAASASAPAGASLADSIGTANANIVGAGATFTAAGDSLHLPGGSPTTQAYVDLPNGVITGTIGGGTRYTSASYEAWLTVNTTQNWARIFSFGTSSAGEITTVGGSFNGDAVHHVFLTASDGTTADQRLARNYPAGTANVYNVTPGTALNGTQIHVVMTYDNVDKNWRWYRNGMLMQTLPDAQGLTTINDVNNWLGRSMWSPDSNIDANYNEFRVYDYALNEAQIRGDFDAGPDVVNTTAGAVSGPYFVSGSGVISAGGASDSLQFASQTLTGNWDVRARLVALTNSNSSALAGLMIREGTAANARHAFIGLSPDAAGHFAARATVAGNTATANLAGLAFPYWVRLVRTGATLAGYVSTDGVAWTQVGATTTFTGLASSLQFGFAVGSGTGATQATALAEFDNFSVRPGPYIWSNATAGSTLPWTQSANWQSSVNAVPGATSAVEFLSGLTVAAGTVTANNDNAGTFPMNSLRLSGTGPVSGIAIAALTGNALQLTGTSPVVTLDATNGTGFTYSVAQPLTLSADTAFTGAGTAVFSFDGVVSGAGGLVKAGASTLTLTAANTYAGPTTISAGTLAIGGAGTLSAAAVTNNATLDFRRTDTALVMANVLGGTGAVTVNGAPASIVTLTGPNTFTGNVTVNVGGLRITKAAALGTGAKTITVLNGHTGFSNVRLDGSGGNIVLPATISFTTTDLNGTIINEAGNNSIAGNFTLTSGGGDTRLTVLAGTLTTTGTFTPDTTNRNLALDGAGNGTFGGVLANGTGANIVGFIKDGAGTWTMSGANTYTGATALNAGALVVNGSIAAGGTVTVASGATLAGTGSIAAATVVNGNHAPGVTIGTQTFTGALTYGAASRMKWELAGNTGAGAGVSFDKITAAAVTVTGGAAIDVLVNSAGSAVDFTTAFWLTARSWTVLTGTSVTGTFAAGTVTNDSATHAAATYGTFAVQQTSTAVNLTWTPFAPIVVWRNLQFGANAGNAAISGDFVDADKDGLVNLMEYATGKNPNAFNPGGLPQPVIEGAYLTMTYTRAKAATDITLRAVWSTAMSGWSAAGVTEAILADDGTIQTVKAKVFIAPDAKKFLRLEATRP